VALIKHNNDKDYDDNDNNNNNKAKCACIRVYLKFKIEDIPRKMECPLTLVYFEELVSLDQHRK